MSRQNESSARRESVGRSSSRRAGRQIKAAVSGAVDEFTLGLADNALAAGAAFSDAVRGEGIATFGKHYDMRLAGKRAEDAYDQHYYGLERGVGRAIGFGGSLVVGGAGARVASAALRSVPQGARVVALLAKAPKLKAAVSPRGMTTLATVGGATAGIVGQGLNDVVSRRRGTPGDYLGAAIGGATGGLATLRGGVTRGGAADGAVTSISQDLLNGRRPSIEEAVEGARAGALTAGLGEAGGTYGSAAAPSRFKGKIGEAFTGARLLASGEGIPVAQKRVHVGKGRYAVPDWTVGDRFYESKLGPNADYTPNQRALRRQRPDKFSTDVWTFRDVGKVSGAAASGLGAHLADDDTYVLLPSR